MTVKEDEPEVYLPGASAQQAVPLQGQPEVAYAQPVAYAPASAVYQPGQSTTYQPGQSTTYQPGQSTTYQPGQSTTYQPGQSVPAKQSQQVTSVVRLPGLGKDPKGIVCPYCQQQGVTSPKHDIDACTIIAVVVLLIVFWPIFWIPFLGSCCKTTNHYCSNCHRKVGSTPACDC